MTNKTEPLSKQFTSPEQADLIKMMTFSFAVSKDLAAKALQKIWFFSPETNEKKENFTFKTQQHKNTTKTIGENKKINVRLHKLSL